MTDEPAQPDAVPLRIDNASGLDAAESRCDGDSIADAQLMARLTRGDMNALAVLVRRHQASVRCLAYRFTSRWDLADDIAQDAFLRVYRSADRYQPTAAFTTWLYRIVVNLCLDWRKRPRLALYDPEAEPPTAREADAPLVRQELSAAVQQAIENLPDRQRMAILLHRFDGLSHDEIAATTGWSRPAVESLLVRAYAQLREALKTWQ